MSYPRAYLLRRLAGPRGGLRWASAPRGEPQRSCCGFLGPLLQDVNWVRQAAAVQLCQQLGHLVRVIVRADDKGPQPVIVQ